MGKWGPLIEHDGSEPTPLLRLQGETVVQCHMPPDSPGTIEPSELTGISTQWPGFYWRWKTIRKGFLGLKNQRIRVCDDPEYRPIVRYRIWQDFSQIEALRQVAQDTKAPITGPELKPRKIKEKTPWLKPHPQKTKTELFNSPAQDRAK